MKFLRFLVYASCLFSVVQSFSLVLMGARRGKRGADSLKRTLSGESEKQSKKRVPNQGKGQEITGVTLPGPGMIRGWEFGEKKTLACANVDGKFYGIEGQCPRCAFDLYKGDLIYEDKGNAAGFEDLPRIACPTCSTTFSLRSGAHGPPLLRQGLRSFTSSLAKTATAGDSNKDAKIYQITREDDGRVYVRER